MLRASIGEHVTMADLNRTPATPKIAGFTPERRAMRR